MNAPDKQMLEETITTDETAEKIRKAKIIAEQEALGMNSVIRAILSGDEREAANLVIVHDTLADELFAKDRLNYKNAVEYAIDARMPEVITAIAERVGNDEMNPYKKRIQDEMGGLDYLINKSKQAHRPHAYSPAKAIK